MSKGERERKEEDRAKAELFTQRRVHPAQEPVSTFHRTGTHSAGHQEKQSRATGNSSVLAQLRRQGGNAQTGLPRAALGRRAHGWGARNERDKALVEGGSQTEYAGYQV